MNGRIEMLRSENRVGDSSSGITANPVEFVCQGPLHWHDYYSFDIILSGEGIHRINGETIPLRPGDVYFVRPTDIHAVGNLPGTGTSLRLLTTGIPEARMPMEYRALLHRGFVTLRPDRKTLERLTMAVEAIMDCNERLRTENGSPSYLLRSVSLYRELILLTYADLLEREVPVSAPAEQDADDPVLSDAVRYLDAHFLEELTVKDVAAAVGLSPAYFSTRFKQAVGCSYVEYLTRRRLNYACSLLSDGANVSDACFSSGFGSLSFFEEVFKKYVGVTPGKYRAMQGK